MKTVVAPWFAPFEANRGKPFRLDLRCVDTQGRFLAVPPTRLDHTILKRPRLLTHCVARDVLSSFWRVQAYLNCFKRFCSCPSVIQRKLSGRLRYFSSSSFLFRPSSCSWLTMASCFPGCLLRVSSSISSCASCWPPCGMVSSSSCWSPSLSSSIVCFVFAPFFRVGLPSMCMSTLFVFFVGLAGSWAFGVLCRCCLRPVAGWFPAPLDSWHVVCFVFIVFFAFNKNKTTA